MHFERGNWIDVNTGHIEDINWRFVNLRTREGNHLKIPNSQLTKSNIINYSHPDSLQGICIKVPINPIFSPEEAKKMLLSEASQCFGISTERPPVKELSALGGNRNTYHQYHLVYYTSKESGYINDLMLFIMNYN